MIIFCGGNIAEVIPATTKYEGLIFAETFCASQSTQYSTLPGLIFSG
jgi:hypothetical protein